MASLIVRYTFLMNAYEIEIKSLIGTKERANELREKLQHIDPNTKLISHKKQLNHYFVGGDIEKLYELLLSKLSRNDQERFKQIVGKGSNFSVRTRKTEDKLLFVVKASLDEGTSHNTVSRLELEVEVTDMTLEALDLLIQKAGFSYQAKWSREREEYICKDVTVCLDRNAGYGYLAEFEKVVHDESAIEKTRQELETFMQSAGFEALPQDRLERMFAYYNTHWPEYYGTEKIFTIH